jgi:hypothetical protein
MTQTQFEDRLLHELRQIVAERPVPEVAPPRRPRARRPLLLAGTATATAAAAGVAFLFAFGSDQSPAFAVDRQSDGSVSVTINRLSDAQGLQSQLRAAGISAVVNYTPSGKSCREPRGREGAPPNNGPASVSGTVVKGGVATFTVTRNLVGSGQTLVITTSGADGPSSVGMQVVQGPVSPCVLVDAPAPPPGASLSTHGQVGGSGSGVQTARARTYGFGTGRGPVMRSSQPGR